MTPSGKSKVLVLGYGRSGAAAAALLSSRNMDVTIVDARELPGVDSVTGLDGLDLASYLFAVVSPGIEYDHLWLDVLRSARVRIKPEFEVGLMLMPKTKVVAVTGSNGKSSVVKWVADALSANGIRAEAAGNIGVPPCELVAGNRIPDVIVLELSSFQLEQSEYFHPDIAVLLNFSPNHLDRHITIEDYRMAKARLFSHLPDDARCYIHDRAIDQFRADIKSRCPVMLFGDGDASGFRYRDGVVQCEDGCEVDLRGTWWERLPQGINAAAGVAVLRDLGIGPEAIRRSAECFEALPHRQEVFASAGGVTFIDDSKASTLSAMAASVQSGTSRKHLIAGGILKENDLSFVKEILVKNCISVYCIGQASSRMVKAWGDAVPCDRSGDLATAVDRIFERVKPGETVLLAPGCSSFDQFGSYAERGTKFKELVRARIG